MLEFQGNVNLHLKVLYRSASRPKIYQHVKAQVYIFISVQNQVKNRYHTNASQTGSFQLLIPNEPFRFWAFSIKLTTMVQLLQSNRLIKRQEHEFARWWSICWEKKNQWKVFCVSCFAIKTFYQGRWWPLLAAWWSHRGKKGCWKESVPQRPQNECGQHHKQILIVKTWCLPFFY